MVGPGSQRPLGLSLPRPPCAELAMRHCRPPGEKPAKWLIAIRLRGPPTPHALTQSNTCSRTLANRLRITRQSLRHAGFAAHLERLRLSAATKASSASASTIMPIDHASFSSYHLTAAACGRARASAPRDRQTQRRHRVPGARETPGLLAVAVWPTQRLQPCSARTGPPPRPRLYL